MTQKTQIREVPAFMTTDDKVHLTREAAERHQAHIDLLNLVELHGYNTMNPSGIVDMLVEHVEQFQDLLQRIQKSK